MKVILSLGSVVFQLQDTTTSLSLFPHLQTRDGEADTVVPNLQSGCD